MRMEIMITTMMIKIQIIQITLVLKRKKMAKTML